MTADQTAVNHRALIAAAAKLERTGWTGDSFRFVESLVLSCRADGYRQVEPPVPPRGSGGSTAAREAALTATAQAIKAAKERRTTGGAA